MSCEKNEKELNILGVFGEFLNVRNAKKVYLMDKGTDLPVSEHNVLRRFVVLCGWERLVEEEVHCRHRLDTEREHEVLLSRSVLRGTNKEELWVHLGVHADKTESVTLAPVLEKRDDYIVNLSKKKKKKIDKISGYFLNLSFDFRI